MRRRQGLVESSEPPLAEKGRILPFRHLRHAFQRAAHSLGQSLRRKTFGQAIDRFMQRQRHCILRRHHIIGMGHLQPVLEAFDFAGNQAARA